MSTKVTWEQWRETWRHISIGGSFGIYEPHDRTFNSREEASGFALGLRSNPHVRTVRVDGVAA